jgi:outer membrane murein-binding lipoprotein Lpp
MWVLSMLSALAGNNAIMAIFAALVGGIGLYVAGGISRAKKDAARRAAEELAAAQGRLEMDREATDAERAARDLPDEAARREAMRWAKH